MLSELSATRFWLDLLEITGINICECCLNRRVVLSAGRRIEAKCDRTAISIAEHVHRGRRVVVVGGTGVDFGVVGRLPEAVATRVEHERLEESETRRAGGSPLYGTGK